MSKSNSPLKRWQAVSDGMFKRFLLPITPHFITPNLISILRLALIPPVIMLLIGRRYVFALLVFIAAAFLDAYDGALARYRQQISKLGLILDPLSDKLLVIGVLGFLFAVYPFSFLLAIIIGLEAVMMLISAIKMKTGATVKSSNIWGKSKMLLQTAGIVLALIWLADPGNGWLYASAGALWISLLLQSISMVLYLA